MPVNPNQARDLFLHAVGKLPPEQWDAYVAEACGEDAELAAHVRQMLQVHRDAGSFLDRPAAVIDETSGFPGNTAPQSEEQPGTTIAGKFKLLEEIGEGGMGAVWLAQQLEPVKRLVAIKLIKPGMDSKQVLARFDAERQALALMDHPNIAKVFDAGTTGEVGSRQSAVGSEERQTDLTTAYCRLPTEGRPYFVMELVKGVPITKYCDEHHLTPRQRLELFIPVCHAIQHAHQKGIIHRDVKPSNVLVAMYDDRPVPKVIDFGVAKATGQQLTEATLHTSFGMVVGTIEYMSPEQASFNQLDVDTRSDIYSLGVLLYELLAGSPPFTKQDLEKAGMMEMLRVIREQEPSKPSTKLSSSDALPSLSTNRGTEPSRLAKLVRGELDWIVMKALEKDRDRRYETANDFAIDLQHYLADEPVRACPPSVSYRLRKFVRRNMRAVVAVTASFLLLIAGIAGTSWGLVRAERSWQAEAGQRQLAEAALVSERKAREAVAEQRTIATEAAQKATREAAIAAAINDFLNQDLLQLSSPLEQASHGLTPDTNLKYRFVLQRAAKRIDGRFANEPEVEMKIRYTIGNALPHIGDYAGALAQYQKVLPWFQETLGPDDPETLLAEYRMAVLHRHLGHNSDIAVPLLERNLEKHKAIMGPQHTQTLEVMNGLSTAYRFGGQKQKALQLGEETLDLRKRFLGPDHPDTLVSMNNVAAIYLEQMLLDKALPLFKETIEGMKKKFPAAHPERLNATRNLARAYYAAEQIDKAIPLKELVMPQFKGAYGLDYAMTQSAIDDLIMSYVEMGWCDKAEGLLKTIQSGGANRPTIEISRQPVASRLVDPLGGTNAIQRQNRRENNHRDLIERVRPAADKYQQEMAAKKADHPDTLAARQALAVVLRTKYRTSAAAYHLKAVLDARQGLPSAEHADNQVCRVELGTIRVQQKKYAEAEPLLLEAYAGLKQLEGTAPETKGHLVATMQRLVQLYDGWDKKDMATEWRQKLEEQKK
jgi:eukaryotic-like serine/threonine-protein kinase